MAVCVAVAYLALAEFPEWAWPADSDSGVAQGGGREWVPKSDFLESCGFSDTAAESSQPPPGLPKGRKKKKAIEKEKEFTRMSIGVAHKRRCGRGVCEDAKI